MAGPKDRYPSDKDVGTIIRIKARILARELRVGDEHRKDFEQELWLHYLRVRRRHDPGRGQWSTFLDRVFENKGRNMIAGWSTGKRCLEREARRWDDPTGGDDDGALTFEEVYGDESHYAETGWGPRPDREIIGTRLDVERTLRRLPSDLRALAQRLMRQSISDAAQELKIPRSTLYGKIQRIAAAFRAAGLDNSGGSLHAANEKN